MQLKAGDIFSVQIFFVQILSCRYFLRIHFLFFGATIMTIGTKQGAVSDCVISVLNGLGLHQIDLTKSLADYNYSQNNMPGVHFNVQACLKLKGYRYTYPDTNAYMKKTVALSLLALIGTIGDQTQAGVTLDAALSLALPKAGRAARKAKVKTPARKAVKKTARKAAKKPGKKAAKKRT
jgi:hypothetical protein